MSLNSYEETATAGNDDAEFAEAASSSCQGCRRRKLRCSRDRPRCAHCQRIDGPCVYGLKKKPGLKPGAIDSIHRRVEALEQTVSELSRSTPPQADATDRGRKETDTAVESAMVKVLSQLAGELQKLNGHGLPHHPTAHAPEATSSSPANSTLSRRSDHADSVPYNPAAMRKRRRLNSSSKPASDPQIPLCDLDSASLPNLPPPGMLQLTIDAYFDAIQPWVPILHETRFRKRISDPVHSESLVVVLHAMVVAALRFVDPRRSKGGNEEGGENEGSERHEGWEDRRRPSQWDDGMAGMAQLLTPEWIEQQVVRSRRFVMLTAMDQLSVENLQALSIVAFSDIGNGDASKAWSIVGSLTRTVEYLQLSIEPEVQDKELLLTPLISLPEPSDWTEEEERRRVFWNIFNLDRFCSVITGWNTSLTANDVHRRLPADGGLWHSEDFVQTPFFGIWDPSAVKMGNSIMFLPAHYTSASQKADRSGQASQPENGPRRNRTAESDHGTTVGAYAYCIEATESLSRVTTFFLRQKVDFEDREEVSSWLTRFKELDLRLVHWKLFLPQKWKDSNISRKPGVIDMDPNLTLAHITHNASTILLHQRIAYPESRWTNIVRLPSAASSDTCQSAACETATIAEKYLKHTPTWSPSTSQFAFCLFVSARVLLVHSKCYNTAVDREFWELTESLDELAKRWAGSILSSTCNQSLAGKYANHLRFLHNQLENDPEFSVDVLSSLTGMAGLGATPRAPGFDVPLAQAQRSAAPQSIADLSVPIMGMNATNNDTEDPSATLHAHGFGEQQPFSGFPSGQADQVQDSLSAISQVLTDQDFLNMDRVISYHDSMFSTLTTGERPGLAGWTPLQPLP